MTCPHVVSSTEGTHYCALSVVQYERQQAQINTLTAALRRLIDDSERFVYPADALDAAKDALAEVIE